MASLENEGVADDDDGSTLEPPTTSALPAYELSGSSEAAA